MRENEREWERMRESEREWERVSSDGALNVNENEKDGEWKKKRERDDKKILISNNSSFVGVGRDILMIFISAKL